MCVRSSRALTLSLALRASLVRQVPEFIAEVTEAFPDKMIATAEEARVLFSELGYVFLDVRPEVELDATPWTFSRDVTDLINAGYLISDPVKVEGQRHRDHYLQLVQR